MGRPPPLQLLAPSGGEDGQGKRWEHLHDLPYELLRRTWHWHVLRMRRQTRKTEAIPQVGDTWCRQ